MSFSRLESDYCRIEMSSVPRCSGRLNSLESDYCRIEMLTDGHFTGKGQIS